MAQGIRLPVESENGRMKLLSGDDYIEQCVYVILGSSETTNPWQDFGLGDFMIFGINDQSTEGEIRTALVNGFAILERDQLAKLEDPTADLIFETYRGRYGEEKRVSLTYTNMETQERRELDLSLPSSS